MKKLLPLAIAATLAAPLAAMADATVYGKVRLSVDDVELNGFTDLFGVLTADEQALLEDVYGIPASDKDMFQINSHASRLGVKGSEDLGDGLKAIYMLEFGVDIAGKQSDEFSPDNPISARNAYVGLAGGFGTALIGRHDTPMKMSTGKLDYFQDTQADFNKVYMGGFEDRRADGTIAYVSPNLAGLTLAAAIIPGENNQADGLADAYSLAAMYSNGGLFLSGAYEAADGNIDAIGVDGMDLSQWRLGAGYDSDVFRVSAVYEQETLDSVVVGEDDIELNKWALNGGFTIGMGEIKATYQTWKEDWSELENTAWALGYDYNMSKRTQLYALYLDSTIEATGIPDLETTIFSVGLNHAF